MADLFGTSNVGSAIVPCPLNQTVEPVYWIEIELLGEDDSPIPGEEYRVELPNGDLARGFLDSQGWARVANIPTSGECEITFPKLDREAWFAHPQPQMGPKIKE